MFEGYNSLVLLRTGLLFWAGHDRNLLVGPELLDELHVCVLPGYGVLSCPDSGSLWFEAVGCLVSFDVFA